MLDKKTLDEIFSQLNSYNQWLAVSKDTDSDFSEKTNSHIPHLFC